MGFIIAIDGPAGAGKGLLSRLLAEELECATLDTGLLYRAVARRVIDTDVDPDDGAACTALALELDPADIDGEGLRTEVIGSVASRIAVHPALRQALLDYQRWFAANPPGMAKGAILDGRDIGTVVCPDADCKLYITAKDDVRAWRRVRDLEARGETASYEEVLLAIQRRDQREQQRETAPMRPADDAVIIDTSDLTVQQVLDAALKAIAPMVQQPTSRAY